MDSEDRCQLCGNPLAPDDEDACPACLLGLGFLDENAGEDPAPEEAVNLSLRHLPPDIKVMGLIGRGGMGVVYQAKQVELDRVVALKILSPQLAEEPEFTVRFAREARLMAKLNHPHIVTVHNFGSSQGFCYLLMECVEGRSLADVIENGGLPPREALDVMLKVCHALRYAHRRGVIHRDIKPENILLDEAGDPKVTDFGLAKLIDGRPHALALTLPAQSLGTPYYMAPEQRDSPMDTDARADVYALGVTLYQLLTGRLPTGRFPLPSATPGVPEALDEVVLKALQSERDLRQADAGELYADLQGLSLESPPDLPAPPREPVPNVSSPNLPTNQERSAEPGKTIFLAFTSSDLDNLRERLRRELISWGHRVVPATPALPLHAPQAEAILRSALMTADIALHPVGSQYGWIPDGSERSIVEIQERLSREEGRRHRMERLFWVPPGAPCTDDRLRRFLVTLHQQHSDPASPSQIHSDPADRFLGLLHDRLTRPETAALHAQSRRPAAPEIYLLSEAADEEAVERLEDYLFDLGFEVTRSQGAGSAEESSADHHRRLATCEAALIFWGHGSKSWLDRQLLDLKNAATFRPEHPIRIQGILIGPPLNRSKERFRTHLAEVMRYQSDFAEVALEPFVVQVAQLLPPRAASPSISPKGDITRREFS